MNTTPSVIRTTRELQWLYFDPKRLILPALFAFGFVFRDVFGTRRLAGGSFWSCADSSTRRVYLTKGSGTRWDARLDSLFLNERGSTRSDLM